MEERLQKFLSSQGICSRRKAEEAILAGRVKVNGETIKTLGTKIDTQKDRVVFDEKIVGNQIEKKYILLNKPIGYVTTVKDQFNRPTVMDLLKINGKPINLSVVPAGRLDMYTSGALILSNDGDFIFEVTHPKHEITKTYQVTLKGKITKEEIEKLAQGVDIGEYITRQAKVRIMKIDEEKDISRIEIEIHSIVDKIFKRERQDQFFGNIYEEEYRPMLKGKEILAWGMINYADELSYNLILVNDNENIYGKWYQLKNSNSAFNQIPRTPEIFAFEFNEIEEELHYINVMHIYNSVLEEYNKDEMIENMEKII